MLTRLQAEGKKRVYMPTHCNGEPCGIETRHKKVGAKSNFYSIGIDIKMRGDGNFIFETWTIYDAHHVLNCHILVDSTGLIVKDSNSKVNCFGLGWVKADQEWMDILLEELEGDLKSGKRKWEVSE